MKKKQKITSILWDFLCTASIIGIWPRFIETNLLTTTRQTLTLPKLPRQLDGLTVLQMSDLHFSSQLSDRFLSRLVKQANRLKPDIIAFTGDFLCYGQLEDSSRLEKFLNQFSAPYGCYAVLGNHDYEQCVSINGSGDYDLLVPPSSSHFRALGRLTTKQKVTGKTTPQAKQVPPNPGLVSLLSRTPFQLLNNDTKTVCVDGAKLNICGLGEHSACRVIPKEAFVNYEKEAPGIILLHNPDGITHLKGYPGDIILSGHTHGGQVNLPWLWKRFTLLENQALKNGMVKHDNRQIYINRGLGSTLPFRWFAPPEMMLLTLKRVCDE